MKPFLVAAFLIAQPAFAEDIYQPAGNWTGLGHQSGESWGMAVHFVPGGARIDYPDLSCGGVWIFDQDDSAIQGTEWLTYGQKNCIDGLRLTVTTTTDGLRISWINHKGGGELAYADLMTEIVGEPGRKTPADN